MLSGIGFLSGLTGTIAFVSTTVTSNLNSPAPVDTTLMVTSSNSPLPGMVMCGAIVLSLLLIFTCLDQYRPKSRATQLHLHRHASRISAKRQAKTHLKAYRMQQVSNTPRKLHNTTLKTTHHPNLHRKKGGNVTPE